MADVPAVTPGPQTSEGKLAIVTVILGVLGTVAPALLEMFSSLKDSFPNSAILATVASCVGMIVTLLTALGYVKQRTALKVAALNADAGTTSGATTTTTKVP